MYLAQRRTKPSKTAHRVQVPTLVGMSREGTSKTEDGPVVTTLSLETGSQRQWPKLETCLKHT